MTYAGELKRAMSWLGAQPGTIFLGQSVAKRGTSMHASFADVDPAKKLEMPVAEELQLGMSIGLSLQGFIPISVYPRWNFLLLAANQLVNHLDRIPLYSEYRPKVIIRTAWGAKNPLDPGPQHCDDFSQAFANMLQTVRVSVLSAKEEIFPAYRQAFERIESTILVECGELARE